MTSENLEEAPNQYQSHAHNTTWTTTAILPSQPTLSISCRLKMAGDFIQCIKQILWNAVSILEPHSTIIQITQLPHTVALDID